MAPLWLVVPGRLGSRTGEHDDAVVASFNFIWINGKGFCDADISLSSTIMVEQTSGTPCFAGTPTRAFIGVSADAYRMVLEPTLWGWHRGLLSVATAI